MSHFTKSSIRFNIGFTDTDKSRIPSLFFSYRGYVRQGHDSGSLIGWVGWYSVRHFIGRIGSNGSSLFIGNSEALNETLTQRFWPKKFVIFKYLLCPTTCHTIMVNFKKFYCL